MQEEAPPVPQGKPPTKRSEVRRLTLEGYSPEEIGAKIGSSRDSVWTMQSQLIAADELPPRPTACLPPNFQGDAARRFHAEARARGLTPNKLLVRIVEALGQHDLYTAVLED